MFVYIKRKTAFSICLILSVSLLLCALIPYATEVNAPKGVENKKEYIKWVDFSIPYEALSDSLDADIKSSSENIHFNWLELLAYLASKYKNEEDEKKFRKSSKKVQKRC